MILIPLVIIGLAATAGVTQHRRNKFAADPRVIAERMMVFRTAIGADDPNTAIKDPAKLHTLSKVFRDEGMIAEADMLEKRALLQERPAEVVAAHKEAFRKGMASTNVPAILAMADEYENMGCTGAADNLRKYAASLKTATVEEKTDESLSAQS